jgi:pilus assembly protein FimV
VTAQQTSRSGLPTPTPRKLAAALAVALLACAGSAWSAGLGRLTVQSALGQPLRAEVEITSMSRDEAATINARLASPEAFRLAGLDYNAALANLRFAIDRRDNGTAVIRISSVQPINEPFIDMLVELSWASGRFVREYTFLLDPPELRSNRQSVEGGAVQSSIVLPSPAASSAPAASAPVAGSTPASAATSPSSAQDKPLSPRAGADARRPAEAPPAAAPAARPARATPPASPDAPPTAPAGGDELREVRVAPGETLGQIAARVKPGSASLDQTLIALYQANPDAFLGNLNRVKANSLLKVPAAADITGIDPAKARELVLAQSSDFNAYRSRLADAAPAADGGKAGQAASGRIGAQVDDRRAAPSQDQLKISRSGTAEGAPAKGGAAVGQASAEQNAAREAALRESQGRIQSLEKNVADLQKLLDLRNRQLGELQKQIDDGRGTAAAAPAEPAKAPAVASAVADAPKADAAPGTPADGPAPVAPAATSAEPPPAASAPPVAAPSAPAPAPAPAAAGSFLDEVLDNPFTLPGVGAVLALGAGFGWFAMRRRRKAQESDEALVPSDGLSANSLFGSTGGQSVDTSTAFTGAGSDVATDAQATEVDPIAEAEVYIAYGREAQAEEILREALRRQPRRQAIRAKLLEIYSGRKDVAAFGELAADMHEMTGGQNEEWPKVASMGLALDPDNPLYSGRASSPPAGEPVQGLFDNESLDPAVGTTTDDAIAFDEEPLQPAATRTDDRGLAFDLDLDPPTVTGEPRTELARAVEGRFELPDLELDMPGAKPQAAVGAKDEFGEIGLDLDLESPSDPADKERWQEMGTKLDLASAYEEIGDKEGARELLDEVLAGGDEEQRAKAREMLARLA